MDRAEASLRTSGAVVADPDVNAYVRQVVCRLTPEYCSDVRIYVVRVPLFNASMAPNGVMQVWTGLLLRVENEAQLACVLGHELAHYVRRHSLQLWRDARAKADFVAVVGALTAGLGALASLPLVGSVAAFSRDQEREADDLGIDLMLGAGYDPREAVRLWEAVFEERQAGQHSAPSIFFATHPPMEERMEALRERARAREADRGWTVGRDAFARAMRPLRSALLREELRRRDFGRSELLLARLLAREPASGELQFFHGELYRLRGDHGDDERAVAAYRRALEASDAPPEAHRVLGVLLMKRGEREAARAQLLRYLEREPAADDRQMVQSYLDRLEVTP